MFISPFDKFYGILINSPDEGAQSVEFFRGQNPAIPEIGKRIKKMECDSSNNGRRISDPW